MRSPVGTPPPVGNAGLLAPAAGIADPAGNGFTSGATLNWINDTNPPTAGFMGELTTPRKWRCR